MSQLHSCKPEPARRSGGCLKTFLGAIPVEAEAVREEDLLSQQHGLVDGSAGDPA